MRDPWLDSLRALAISSVALYHVVQMAPVPLAIARLTSFGALGVDVFFVLSGFLIGRLYWKEHVRRGQVALLLFWKRRWWRTLPPYYAALTLSWLAVFASRDEPFDWRFLFFLQNYAREIPFFLVSWSLCVEEHFYLFLPLVLRPTASTKALLVTTFCALIAAPMILRHLTIQDGLAPEFGLEQTATHLRMEGLFMGFALSAIAVRAPQAFVRLQRLARVLAVPLLGLAAWCVASKDAYVVYVIGYGAVALATSTALLAGVGTTIRAPGVLQTLIHGLALISYSVYLTHALVIHAARLLADRLQLGVAGYLAVAPLLILATGAVFYFCVEKPSIQIRERLAPS